MARSGARFALAALALALSGGAAQPQALKYPPPPRSDVADDYFGTRVADPFRPLEDMGAAETLAWVRAENAVTDAYLGAIPERQRFRARLQQLVTSDLAVAPQHLGNLFVYLRRRAGQSQPALYAQKSLGDTGVVLVDPNALSPDGRVSVPVYSQGGFAPSPDGRLLAYATSRSGSDWTELHVRDIAGGQDLADRLRWVRFSLLSWTHDSRGFFYSRYPEPAGGEPARGIPEHHELWYHRVGTGQEADVRVYARPDQPKLVMAGWVTSDGRYLVIMVTQGGAAFQQVYVQDLVDPRRPQLAEKPAPLFDPADARFTVLNNRGRTFYARTTKGAPKGRVVAVDLRHPEPTAWKTVVPEGPDVMVRTELVGDRLAIVYVRDVRSVVVLYHLDGRLAGELPLPAIGTVADITGGPGDRDLFLAFTSFLYPYTVLHYDLGTGKRDVFKPYTLAFDAGAFETRQVFYTSKDGTRVPMFLTYRKGLRLDGTNPTLIQVYGAFAYVLPLSFSTQTLVWLENGGIWAQPGVRGGAEYGEGWHQAAVREKKQNTFDDVIAAAEYLVREHYTSPGRLGLRGQSAGGLTVSAVETQRPDLFAVALPYVASYDMLRFTKLTVGAAWTVEYGSPETPEGFRTLYAYSPLHNVKPGRCYPATLVSTGEHDDLVAPAHAYKFAATLQADQGCDRPVLLRVTGSGHGAGSPAAQAMDDAADYLAFAWKSMGLEAAVGAGGGPPQH